MCGILGYVGPRDGRPILETGLTRLEYRGYDSAGVALRTDGGLAVEKVVGRVRGLHLGDLPPTGLAVGHTRWATHGAPSVANAHPHLSCDGRIAVVHNGIIANHAELRADLESRGHVFVSETDTEVIAHLIEDAYASAGDLAPAVRKALGALEGSYAICVVHQDHPGELVATRNESPLVLGVGESEFFVASDVVAFLDHTNRVVFLHDGDFVHVISGAFHVFPAKPRDVTVEVVPWSIQEATLAGFPHFMLKEIFEQPRALREGLLGRVTLGALAVEGPMPLSELARATDVHLIASGSSHHAGLVARSLFEDTLGVPARCHVASEVDERGPLVGERPLFVAVSQSGETADTLRAVRAVRRVGHEVFALANVVGSSLTREATAWMPLRAGPELSVAATKSFTSQVLALGLLAVHLGHLAGRRAEPEALLFGLRQVPHAVQTVLDNADAFAAAGRELARSEHCFVLGSGALLPVALETALKIKEVSYIHAEAFATGELKHGPLALVEQGTHALAFAPAGRRLAQALSSMREIAARGGRVIALTETPDAITDAGIEALPLGTAPWPGNLFSAAVAGQLLAYHAAVARGCDVDRPRNLAKSVTVE